MSYVLVVDDDPDVHVLMQDILGTLQLEGRVAHNGQAALDMARQELPAAMILDLMMPGVDGYGVLKELQADPALAGVPVVVLSAYVDEHEYSMKEHPNVIGVVSKGMPTARKISQYLREALGL